MEIFAAQEICLFDKHTRDPVHPQPHMCGTSKEKISAIPSTVLPVPPIHLFFPPNSTIQPCVPSCGGYPDSTRDGSTVSAMDQASDIRGDNDIKTPFIRQAVQAVSRPLRLATGTLLQIHRLVGYLILSPPRKELSRLMQCHNDRYYQRNSEANQFTNNRLGTFRRQLVTLRGQFQCAMATSSALMEFVSHSKQSRWVFVIAMITPR